MFIDCAVYRSIDISELELPIEEGTILDSNGEVVTDEIEYAYGIVPERIDVMPPTKMANIAVSGVIDLDSPANQSFAEMISHYGDQRVGMGIGLVQLLPHREDYYNDDQPTPT